ncbi:MAG: hypothetical protein NVSMB13_16180 [Mycobacteriales bacterium]
MSGSRRRFGAVLVAAALLSAACGGSGSKTKDGAGAKTQTLKYAVVAELTGKFAPYGTQLQAGAKAAAAELNKSGKYNFTLEPVFYDCQSDQAICVSKTREAITTDKAPLVMGPVVSLDILPSAEVTQRQSVPHVVFAVLPAITDSYKNTFRWSAQNDVNNNTVVDFVKNKLAPGESVGIVHANTEFGNGGATQQVTGLTKVGITPVANIGHDPDRADYTPVMVELQKKQPKYILLSDSNPADIAKLLRQAHELGVKGTWLGADASGAITLAGADAVGYLTVAPWFPNNTADPNSTALTDKLKAQGVADPGWIAAMAYDATKGVAEAAKAKGLGAAELMAGLSSLSNMQGTAAKSWTFSADNRRGLPAATIANWTGKGYETVWPKS